MAARKQEPQGGSVLGSAVTTNVVAPALCLVLLWLGLPGVAVVWLALVVRAMSAQPPELTGPRKDGRPTVGSDREQKRMDAYLRVVDIRDACLDPTGVAPGWPVRSSWLVGVLVGVLAWLVPQAWEATRWVNAILALVVVSAVAAAGRNKDRSEPSPGTRVDTLPALFKAAPVRSVAGAVLGGVGGAAVGLVGVALCTLGLWADLRDRLFALQLPEVGPVPWPQAMAVLPHTPGWQFVLAAAGLGAVIGVWKRWQRVALEHWWQVVQARGEWAVRWPVVKADPAPRLVDVRVIESAAGPVIVESFTCQAGFPAEKAMAVSALLRPTLGDDSVRLAMLPLPQTDPKTNQPIPGTASTLGFRAVRWPGGLADITDPATDPDLVSLALESAMVWSAESTGWSRMLLVDVSRISVEPGKGRQPLLQFDESDVSDPDDRSAETSAEPGRDRQAWAVQWASPIGMEMVQVRLNMAGSMAGSLGCEVLVDHRATGGSLRGQGVMYAGALTDGSAELDEGAMPAPGQTPPEETLVNLSTEDWWVGVWGSVLGSDANPPTVKHNVRSTVTLPNGAEITTQPFTVRHGQDPRTFFGTEAKLSSAMDSMSFVTVTGFPDRSTRRPGDRHPMAFQVHYSRRQVPGITTLPPGPETSGQPSAALPLLAGRVNAAFRAAKLAQPEVYAVRCLTEPSSRGHIWEASIRLFDGVTLSDLRGRHKQLAIALGVPWLRIVEHGNDCRIVAGVDPVSARMGERERAEVVGYDWEQVWRDARCTGVDGALPSVLSVKSLPSNPAVQELVFRIPNGLDVPRLKAAKNKLATASENGFVDIAPGPEPATVRLLVARDDPMPTSAPYRFELDPGEGRLAFADGVDGEPVVMDLSEVAHLMLVGTSGGGKTTAGLTLLQGALAGGAEVAVIDVQKGCADFRYAEPWCMAMTGDLMDAAATMTALYAEVGRRRDLNTEHGVGSIRDLPEDVRPPEVFVFVDEFYGLISSPEKPATKPESNPDMEAARLEALAAYNAKAKIAYVTGRLGAEARSAGFHLVLMTQALSSKMKLPSSIADLKLNSNRILLGKATHGERTSALRQPESAPDLGDVVPRGRAVYEPVVGEARLVQFWHAPTSDYAAWLEDNVEQVTPDEMLDIEPHRMDTMSSAAFVVTDEHGTPGSPAGTRVVVDETGSDGTTSAMGPVVVVESSVELFEDFDLPELVDDETVDWSLVVGMEPPPGVGGVPMFELAGHDTDVPPEATDSQEKPARAGIPDDDWFGGEPLEPTRSDPGGLEPFGTWDGIGNGRPTGAGRSGRDGVPDDCDDDDEFGDAPVYAPPPVEPIRPTRAVVTGFDDEKEPSRARPGWPPTFDEDEAGFGDFGESGPPAGDTGRTPPSGQLAAERAVQGRARVSLTDPLAGLRRS